MGTHHQVEPDPEPEQERQLSRFTRYQPTVVALVEFATAVVGLLAALKGCGPVF